MPSIAETTGAHSTPERIARRTLGPLVFDELWARCAAAEDAAALEALHDRLASLRFLDPACGCGSFLAAALAELRRLEQAVLRRRAVLGGGRCPRPRVSEKQFHGIELDARAAATAATAGLRVHHADALVLDWTGVLPAGDGVFIVGNPPFVAKQHRSGDQATKLRHVFGGAAGHGALDHAAAWLELASRYVAGTDARVGLVVTSSVCQGEQVAVLWPRLLARGVRIDFAHRTFAWAGTSAVVAVVIVGFSDGGRRREKLLFDYATPHGEPRRRAVRRISPYLADGPDVVVRARRTPLGPVPPMAFGSMPNDGGHLLLDAAERQAILDHDPVAARHVRPLLGARGLMGGAPRWCIWLAGAGPVEEDLRTSPVLRARVEAVRRHRAASRRASTRRLAATPARFGEVRQPATRYLCVPRHGAERRRCAPMAFASPDVIAHDSTLTVAGADAYLFGLLQSALFTAWLRGVAGRIRGDPRVSAELVYNTFPFPAEPLPALRDAVERAAAAVLAARAAHPSLALDRLYEPADMPGDLACAHDALDAAVDALFGLIEGDEALRLGELLRRYEALAAGGHPAPRYLARGQERAGSAGSLEDRGGSDGVRLGGDTG